jgi:hypothetical protein
MIDRIAKTSLLKNKLIPILFMVLLAISFPLQVFAEEAEEKEQKKEDLISNEEFLRESVRMLLREAMVDLPLPESRFMLVKPQEENSANWLLEDELVSYLRPLNVHVALDAGANSNELPQAWSLFYHIIEMKLSYPEVKRKGIFGHKSVIRKAKLNLSFRLEERKSGKVLWTKRETGERSDVVKRSAIKYLNNDSYSFLSPTLPEDPQARYLEPALVAAVVGGLIYLFFANR